MITSSCHCGAVRLEIAEAPATITECNCSICRRIGGLWAYYHPDQVKRVGAPDATLVYVWGDKMLELHTCKTCGCTTHWERIEKAGADRMGVNARMMEPSVIQGVKIKHLDGAESWQTVGWSVFPSFTAGSSEPK